jgi:putative aldouronate transport system substrate-binding protein
LFYRLRKKAKFYNEEKRMAKKILFIAVLLTITASLVFAGARSQSTGGGGLAGGEIRVFSGVTGGKDDEENELFRQALEKAAGLKINFEKIAGQNLMQKLGAGEIYDLIYFGQGEMYTFVEQGILTDLTGRINNSPVLKANYPAGELEKIGVNGKYYAGFNKLEVFTLPNVNKAITDKAGVDLSKLTTLDDYYNMLKTVKNYMENTEGKKPFYPFYTYMPDIWDLQPWFSSLGLRRGVFVDAGGRKYAPFATAAAAPVWTWLAKLYAEELLDPTSFTGRTGDMRSRMWQSQDIVMDVDWVAWTGLYNTNAQTAGTYPAQVNVVGLPGVKGPSGKYLLEQGGASLWGIPVNAKNPDGAFKLIEFFATKEGALLLSAGIEGHDYTLQNGKVALTQTGIAHGRDHGAPFPISTQFDLAILGDMNPGVAESYAIGKQSDVEVEPMGFANGQLDSRQYYDIMSKWMTDCIMGRLDAAAAINGAAAELRGKGIID